MSCCNDTFELMYMLYFITNGARVEEAMLVRTMSHSIAKLATNHLPSQTIAALESDAGGQPQEKLQERLCSPSRQQ
jgi:hypothetical protein